MGWSVLRITGIHESCNFLDNQYIQELHNSWHICAHPYWGHNICYAYPPVSLYRLCIKIIQYMIKNPFILILFVYMIRTFIYLCKQLSFLCFDHNNVVHKNIIKNLIFDMIFFSVLITKFCLPFFFYLILCGG